MTSLNTKLLNAHSISSVNTNKAGIEVRITSSKQHHSVCHCFQLRFRFKDW